MASSERGTYRGVYCALVDRLADEGRTPEERHVFLTARLSEQAGPACIFRFNPAVLAHQTGLSVARVVKAIRSLEPDWVEYEPPVLWIKNGLRYDPHVHVRNPTQRTGIVRWISALPRLSIVLKFCDYYEIARPFDGGVVMPSNGGVDVREVGRSGSSGVLPEEAEESGNGSNTSPTASGPPWRRPDDLVELWNQLAPPGLARVTRLSPKRRSKCLKYLHDFPEREFWVRCFSELKFSRFLLGLAPSPGHENFRGEFDWVLSTGKDGSENAVKVAEGRYRDKEHR